MKFKRRLLITMLAAAQVSMAVPVSAHTQAGSISSQEMPELGTEVLNMEQTEVQMQDPMAADDAANSISDTLILEDTDIEEEPFGVETKEVQEQEAVQQGKSEPVIQAEAEPAELPSDKTAVTGNVTDELILLMNSPVMYHNGQMYKAAQPMAVKSGVSYVSIRALVEHAGLKLSYDNKTKETIIFKNGSEIRFTTDSSKYKVNGEQRPMKGPAYQYKNTFMVPLTSITQALGIPYTVNQPEKKVILNLSGMTARDGESPESPADTPVPNEPGLILMMNSNKMYHNGTLYTAAQPMAVKSGVSYVAIRSLVDRTGLKLSYDSSTKETVIRRGSDELRFKTDSSIYTVNGVKKTMKGPAYQYKNTFMVPLTSITQALDIPYTVDQPNKRVILTLSTKPVASFTILNSEIFAGQTVVQYKSNAYSPAGLPIVDERWEGREEIYNMPGVHTVTYSVQDSSGEWSDPYSVTIQVLVPNEPPQAMFTTDKEQYKMGEKITYTDLSTDDESAIVKRDWDNNAKAFFTPGPVTIGLTVTDKHGLTDYYEKTVIITGETLYTREEFYQLFADLGEKYVMDGSSVPSLPQVNYTRTSEARMLIRSNSPETVYSEGIVYRETGIGSTRFMIHHLNATGKTMKMYVVATNFNSIPVNLTTETVGMGGPIDIPTATGKASVERFLESMQTNDAYQVTTLQPGERRLILTQINAQSLKNEQVISLFADLYTDAPVQYDVVMIEENKDPIAKLSYLRLLPTDGVHNRGTYDEATRTIESSELIGSTPVRLAIGDKNSDPYLTGYDGITGYETTNSGNFGVLYRIKLNRVAPNTLITLNPRGGKYMGAIMVNGNIIDAPTSGAVSAPNEASVLYRTGNFEQSVEILFTAAPGSSLPVNLLFTPLPPLKTNN